MTYIAIILLIIGLVLVLVGSDALVDGASAIARRSGVSEFVIGLTIVGIGTSMPEMVVSWLSAFQGKTDMSVGNIVGSNIFNTCLILGATALILPITITKSNLKRDMPLNILAALLLILYGMNGTILHRGTDGLSRLDGALMVILFALYLFYCFKSSGKNSNQDVDSDTAEQPKDINITKAICFVILGFAALIAGGKMFVDNAVIIAKALGWSDKFIGITILAGGTSLPELATCIVAAAKKKGQLALGNILGSNVSNILFILGGSALIHPIAFDNVTLIDMGFLLLSALILPIFYFTFSKRKIGRLDGTVLLLLEAVYMFLLIRAL